MAQLKPCPDCGRQVSLSATSCPNCGRVLKPNAQANQLLLAIGLIIVVIVVIFLVINTFSVIR